MRILMSIMHFASDSVFFARMSPMRYVMMHQENGWSYKHNNRVQKNCKFERILGMVKTSSFKFQK